MIRCSEIFDKIVLGVGVLYRMLPRSVARMEKGDVQVPASNENRSAPGSPNSTYAPRSDAWKYVEHILPVFC